MQNQKHPGKTLNLPGGKTCEACSLLWKVTIASLLETVADLLMQHCHQAAGHPGWLMDGALSSNEDAIDILDQHGLIEHHPNMAWFKIKWNDLEGMKKNETG